MTVLHMKHASNRLSQKNDAAPLSQCGSPELCMLTDADDDVHVPETKEITDEALTGFAQLIAQFPHHAAANYINQSATYQPS